MVDFDNSFHPDSAFSCGVQLDRLLWIRCKSNPEYTMKSADLLLHAGGFGVVLLDLSGAHANVLNRIPISYWYRFQRAIQNTLLHPFNLRPMRRKQKPASRDSLVCQAKSFSWLGQRPFTRLCGITTIARQRKLASIRREEPLQILVASFPMENRLLTRAAQT